jgi:hypothetical protein
MPRRHLECVVLHREREVLVREALDALPMDRQSQRMRSELGILRKW